MMLFLKNTKNSFFSFVIINIFPLLIISRLFFAINLIYILYISIKYKVLRRLNEYYFFRRSFLFFIILYTIFIFINFFLNNSFINQLAFISLIFLFFFSFFFGYYLYKNRDIHISFARLVLYFNIFIIGDIFLYRLLSTSIFPFIEDLHIHSGFTRYAGIFLERKVLGGYLCVTFPIIYNYLNLRVKNIDLIFLKNPYFYSFIYFIAIVLTGDRRPSFIFGVILFLYFFFQKKNKFNSNNLLIYLFSLLFLSLIIYLNNSLFSRLILDTFNVIMNIHNSSYTEKGDWFQLYQSSFAIISHSFQNFIIGVGSKNFTKNCIEIVGMFCSTHPHNLYVEMFVSFGFIGFCIFCICIYKFLKFIIKLLLVLKLKDRHKALSSLFIQVYFFMPLLPSGSLFAIDLLIYYSILNSILILNLLSLNDYYDFKKI